MKKGVIKLAPVNDTNDSSHFYVNGIVEGINDGELVKVTVQGSARVRDFSTRTQRSSFTLKVPKEYLGNGLVQYIVKIDTVEAMDSFFIRPMNLGSIKVLDVRKTKLTIDYTFFNVKNSVRPIVLSIRDKKGVQTINLSENYFLPSRLTVPLKRPVEGAGYACATIRDFNDKPICITTKF